MKKKAVEKLRPACFSLKKQNKTKNTVSNKFQKNPGVSQSIQNSYLQSAFLVVFFKKLFQKVGFSAKYLMVQVLRG